MNLKKVRHTLKTGELYEYGELNNLKARRNKITGSVEFLMWEAGQFGRKEDYWTQFESSWWGQLKRMNRKLKHSHNSRHDPAANSYNPIPFNLLFQL